MDKLTMCRICLVEDVKMYSLISANLQELYEKLTKTPFVTQDKKPVQVCYLCRARLQNCHRLQLACLKSEEFLNNIADSELSETELQDLNALRTVHPLILISCVPSTRKDPEDDKIVEDNDFKFDPLEITSDVQVKFEIFEDDSFTNEEVYIKSESTVEEEDICAEDGDISDNIHTMQDTELEHDIHLTTAKIVLERIDLEQFKVGGFAAKKPKPDLPNGNSDSIISTEPTELTVIQNSNNIEEKIQTMVLYSPSVTVENKNIVVERMHTSEKKPYMSKVCEESSRKNHVCDICKQSFTQKSHLVNHARKHTGEKPYRCNTCGKKYIQRNTLVRHMCIHTGETPYSCNICEERFIQKSLLIQHTLIHTGVGPYKCNVCEQTFIRKSYLRKHRRIHTVDKPLKCKVCEKSFAKITYLKDHSRIHSGERPFICHICEQNFNRKSTLIIHLRKHSGDKPYRCNVCEQSFAHKSSLVRHSHIHTGERLHSCNLCEGSYVTKSELRIHSRTHSGEKPYSCKICKMNFSDKRNLKSHMLIHSTVRPYTCDVCQKGFIRKIDLIRHFNIHIKSN